MQLYEESSQFKRWFMSAEKLKEVRQKVNEEAVNRARKALEEEYTLRAAASPNTPIPKIDETEFITWEEQLDYCRYYETKIADFCRVFQLDKTVQATAITFFKRFYLINSAIEYDAKLLLMTCVFLSTKVENAFKPLEQFAQKARQWPSTEEMLELEFTLSKGIRFDFMIQHPYWAVDGLYLDLQLYIEHEILNKDKSQQIVWMRGLNVAYENAKLYADAAVRTDLCFTAMPSQVGLACWAGAVRTDGKDKQKKTGLEELGIQERLDHFISTRLSLLSPDELVQFKSRLEAMTEEIIDELLAVKGAYKERATAIDRKLAACKNPEFDKNSLVYQENVRKEEAEKAERQRVKREREREQNEVLASVVL
ncbi:hypothetical protein HDV00_008550 [Rhizophlyctis rosea]|nr:hypothetical protein HDV00_008550 [Rhizophlyctis rosea]